MLSNLLALLFLLKLVEKIPSVCSYDLGDFVESVASRMPNFFII